MSESAHRRRRARSTSVVALALLLAAVGGGLASTALRLHVAGLPAGRGLFVVSLGHSLTRGVVLVALVAALLGVLGAAAYGAASPWWAFHGPDWADIVQRGGVRSAYRDLHADDRRLADRRARRGLALRAAPADPRVASSAPGARLLRTVAGFNLIALSGALGLAAGQLVAEFTGAWWAVAAAALLVALAAHALITRLGPLAFHPAVHTAAGAAIGAVGLLASPAIGLLVLAALFIATAGRRLARSASTRSLAALAASPVPWLAGLVYAAVILAYEAAPPVIFPAAAVPAPGGPALGGELAGSSARVHLLQCTPLADATSTDARIVSLPARGRTGAGEAAFDPGGRPSLLAVALGLAGLPGPRAVFVASLRARRVTCAGALPPRLSAGVEDPALGLGVIAGPAPASGRAQNGEPPIEQTTAPAIARLARRYQPTLLVTVADRFWPVSVGALLADVGPDGERSCLSATQTSATCAAPVTFAPTASSTAYLRFPSTADRQRPAVTEDPTAQFLAFERGEGAEPGSTHHWLADPGALAPWRTAEVYFYYAGPVHFGGVPGRLPAWPAASAIETSPAGALARRDGLIGLQYWFFYPYNYYPLIVRGSLMNGAPLAATVHSVDLHQGDWEHVTVLLDARTRAPAFLYTARHSDEGAFYAWRGGGLRFDDGHPVLQAAYGGHPTYPAGCGQRVRTKHGSGLMSDWEVCGSGRFAFRAATTPLVDLAGPGTPWACWPGHFGEARYGLEVSDPNADWFTTVIDAYVDVAGPRSPLWQAENGSVNHEGVCRDGGPGAAQAVAVHNQREGRT